MERRQQLERPPRLLSLQPAVLELSAMMAQISNELMTQGDAVQLISDEAVASRENVRAGTRELEKAVARPSLMKKFVVGLIASATLLILFLDWFSP
jgi:t-SNARE complex subunit (syntaxin)